MPILPIDTTTVRLAWHARQRMSTLRITEAEVWLALARPDLTLAGGHGRDRTIYVSGQIHVVLANATNTVVTVKLRTPVPYVHGVHHTSNLPTHREAASVGKAQ